MIRIKIGFADSDRIYLERFTAMMERKHGNTIEIYSFTDPLAAVQAVNENRIDLLVASRDAEIKTEELSGSCEFAYLTESKEIDTLDGRKTIFRYQKTETLYRSLIDLCSGKECDSVKYRQSSNRARISLFVPECEGAGASTSAAAMASYCASGGRKTLFLNLRQFHETEELFTASGTATFTDVIFALKSRNVNLPLKIESIVKKSSDGVHFFGSCRNPLDMAELNSEELSDLLNVLRDGCGYESIVIVSDFFISDRLSLLLDKSDDVIIVSGDSPSAGQRLLQKQAAISGLEKRNSAGFTEKLKILFNKSCGALQLGIPVLGVIPDTGSRVTGDIIKRMTATGVFRCIYRGEAAV